MKNNFQLAHASDPQIDQLLKKIADQLQPPFTQRLALLYITDALHDQMHSILRYLKDHTGIPHWAGTVGIGIIGGDTEYYDVPAIALMLCDLNEDEFAMLPPLHDNLVPFITELTPWLQKNNPQYALLHGDPYNNLIPTLLEQLASHSPATHFNGGLSSSRDSTPQVCDTLTTGSLSGVLFANSLPLLSNLSQGCTPIGPLHEVTRAERNIVIELDNEPALDVFKRDIGEVLARDLHRAAGYIFTGIATDTDHPDDYTVRNIIGVDQRNNIFAIGEYIHQGQQLLFTRRDGNTAQRDMQRMLDEIKQQLKQAKRTPLGGLYISCTGRGKNQFGDHSEEVGMIRNTLGEFPLTGFYANGELFNNRLYAFTGVLILFL